MTTILPAYSETHKELQDAIDNPKPLSDKEVGDTLNKLNDTVTSPESTKSLLNEIRALTGYALSIDDSFYNIEVVFKSIQTSGTSIQLQNDVSTLTTTWKVYRQNYIDLLWKSREVAGKAQAAADDFGKDFIGFLADDDVTLEEKKQEIQNYIVELNKDEKAAQEMSQGFTNLQKNIFTFQQDWQKVVDKHDLKTLAKDIKQLDDDIEVLEGTLADLNKKIKDLAIALGVLSASAGITAALGFICPAFWIGTIISIIGIGVAAGLIAKAMKERDQCQRDIKDKQAQRAEKAADKAAIEQLQAGLDKSKGDFNNILEKIGAFGTVWAIIRADLQAISEKLDYVNTSSKALFKIRLKTAATLYATLSTALREYQIVVNQDSKVFAGRH